jgi:hypothetical protein
MALPARKWRDGFEPVRRALRRGDVTEATAEIHRILERAPAAAFDRALQLAVELNLIDLARDLVARAVSRHPRDRKLEHWARVLAPPEVKLSSRKTESAQHAEWDWLREHGQEYRGKWVVLSAGKLVAANEELATALRQARKRTSAPTLVHFISA